jgi:phosphatidylserine/phosphatidylglycerophosphate/cardiolipin synthase-like enzyme
VRRITTRGGGPTRAVDEALQATLVAELLCPSKQVWLLSPWISDIPVLDNRGGEVTSLLPGAPLRDLSLTEVLRVIAQRGTEVIVVVRPDPRNDAVVDRLRDPTRDVGSAMRVVVSKNLHDKGFLTDHVYFEGSMNFTHHGRTVNEEGVTVSRDQDLLSRMRIDFEARFGRSGGR